MRAGMRTKKLQGTLLTFFSPLRNDLRLFETDSHTRLVRFQTFLVILTGAGGVQSSGQLLHMHRTIRRLLKASPDTTFRDEYPDN